MYTRSIGDYSSKTDSICYMYGDQNSGAIAGPTSISLILFCCSGQLVLYVQSNGNETACPNGTDPIVNCRLLSEYATDPSYLTLDLNTTLKFVFLPGEHVLDSV